MSYVDSLPGHERQRILKRLRSPEAYERLRENVKGPEDLEKALDHSERMAELHFALESDPTAHERLKTMLERALQDGGIESVLEQGTALSDAARAAVSEGHFTLTVAGTPKTHEDALMVIPEGNVAEKAPVKVSLMEACVSQLFGNA